MNINNEIIFKFFDVTLLWKEDIPNIKITLKTEYKTKPPLYKIDLANKKIPYSGAQLEFYVHYLDDKYLAQIVFNERRKLFAKTTILQWYLETYQVTPTEHDNIIKCINSIAQKLSNKQWELWHVPSIKQEQVREKLCKSARRNAKASGDRLRKNWQDKEWRKKYINDKIKKGSWKNAGIALSERYKNDIEFRNKMLKKQRNPIRIKKISNAAKKMWREAKQNDSEKVLRMLPTYTKNYEISGYKVNYIEFIMGTILNEFNIKWEYEKLFVFSPNKRAYIPDFYISDKKIIIECYGDYWHANPTLFSGDKLLFKKILAKDKWKQDQERKEIFEANGYIYLNFWETDIKNNIDTIKNIIKNELY